MRLKPTIYSVEYFNTTACYHASFYGRVFADYLDCVSTIREHMDFVGDYIYAVVKFDDGTELHIHHNFVTFNMIVRI